MGCLLGVEGAGDRRIGVVLEELVDQGDHLVGGFAELPGVERDGQVQGVVTAAGKPDGGGDGVLAAGEGHVADQQAQEAFALARRGGRVVPQRGQVGGQGADPGALLLVERGGGGLGGGVVVLGAGEFAQAGVPVGFEGVGN